MNTPPEITFLHLQPSEAVESRIRSEIEALHGRFSRITSCRVVVEAAHHHRQHDREVQVRIDVGIPGAHILVNHGPSAHSSLTQSGADAVTKQAERQPDHKDIYVCIRDAFTAARRQLEDHVQGLRDERTSGPRISELEVR